MRLIRSVTTLLVAAVFLVACESEEQKYLAQGKDLFDANCKVCHAQGINGAPIIGNKKMWGPRAVQSKETLVQHAIDGFGLMPPKGGANHLDKAQIENVVTYMLSQIER